MQWRTRVWRRAAHLAAARTPSAAVTFVVSAVAVAAAAPK
jgi:hypothetical protein